jgi:hypothetical protein
VLRFPLEEMSFRIDALSWVEEKRKTVARRGELKITPFVVALTQHGLPAQERLERNGVKL